MSIHERIFDLAKAPDRLPTQSLLLPDRLILNFRSRVHFQEAIDMAAKTKGPDVMNALVGVATNMTDVGIPPTTVLERLTSIRDGISIENDPNGANKQMRSFIELGISDVLGMLGDTAAFSTLLKSPEEDDSLRAVSPYICAGEALIRRGKNPTPVLEQAMDIIARNNPHYDDYFGKTIDYVRVAGVLHKAGLDPKIAFSRAEETIHIARERSTRESFDYRAYEELAAGYAACGFADDALRMIDLIGEVVGEDYVRDWEVSKTLQRIARAHLSQGNYEAAAAAARRVNWNLFTAKILAHKAVGESRQGINTTPTINEAASLIKDAKYEEAYEEVYPVLGLAHALSGRTEEAEAAFREVRAAIDEMDVLYKADVGFALARAIDQAGYDAVELYRQSFEWADEFRTKEPGLESMFGTSWGMYENGISALIEMGQFDLAREYLNKYQNSPWPKSRLLGELAKKEAEKGLSPLEINRLTPLEVQQLLSGDEPVRQAALYFGLDKKVV